MEVVKTILTRRSMRDYKIEKVSKDIVNKILECALAAPSAKNSNPWFFLVLDGKNKDEVSKWMREAVENKNSHTAPIDPESGLPSKIWGDSTLLSSGIIEKSSTLILIFNRSPFIKGRENLVKHANLETIYTYSDEIVGIGAAVENILLAAHGLGLGAVCLADVHPAERRIQVKYKIDYELIVGVPIGYPAFKIPRRKLNEGLVRFI